MPVQNVDPLLESLETAITHYTTIETTAVTLEGFGQAQDSAKQVARASVETLAALALPTVPNELNLKLLLDALGDVDAKRADLKVLEYHVPEVFR